MNESRSQRTLSLDRVRYLAWEPYLVPGDVIVGLSPLSSIDSKRFALVTSVDLLRARFMVVQTHGRRTAWCTSSHLDRMLRANEARIIRSCDVETTVVPRQRT